MEPASSTTGAEAGQTSGLQAGVEGGSGRPDPARDRRQRGRAAITAAVGAVLVMLIVAGGLVWWYESHFVSTDDAFIDARVAQISPRVAGQVIAVPVTDNQQVGPGQILAQIDPTPYRVALQRALAAERQARTGLASARASLLVARAALQQAIAGLASARAQSVNATQERKRYLSLRANHPKAVSRSQTDLVEAQARSAAAEQRAARQRVVGARAQIAAAKAAIAGAGASVAAAQARVHAARLDLSYTALRAPTAGHIAQRSVAVGNYVAPGQSLMALVPLRLWVTANFKETDLPYIRPGEKVRVHIDACPGADAHGRVESIQRGSGEAFDLLPPQNATGNYIKIVQRVPVRIVFGALSRHCVLGPGMSVEPKIRVN